MKYSEGACSKIRQTMATRGGAITRHARQSVIGDLGVRGGLALPAIGASGVDLQSTVEEFGISDFDVRQRASPFATKLRIHVLIGALSLCQMLSKVSIVKEFIERRPSSRRSRSVGS